MCPNHTFYFLTLYSLFTRCSISLRHRYIHGLHSTFLIEQDAMCKLPAALTNTSPRLPTEASESSGFSVTVLAESMIIVSTSAFQVTTVTPLNCNCSWSHRVRRGASLVDGTKCERDRRPTLCKSTYGVTLESVHPNLVDEPSTSLYRRIKKEEKRQNEKGKHTIYSA